MPSTATYTWETRSRVFQAGEFGEDSTVQEVRQIWRNDGAAFNVDTDMTTAESEGAVSRRGDLGYLSGTGLTWQQFVRFRGYTVRQLPNASGAELTLTWSTRYVLTLHGGSPPTLFYTPRSGLNFASLSRSILIYRTGWSVAPPAALDVSATDIGGTAISGGNDGQAYLVAQNRFRLTFEQDSTVTTMQAAAASFQSYQNKKNSATFLGMPANTVICEGVHLNPVKYEFYEVSFDFLFDEFYHHEQVPTMDPDGRIKRNNTGPTEVKWKRLPRTGVDFNLIYGGSTPLKNITERGYALP
jgi:hypothetical protein